MKPVGRWISCLLVQSVEFTVKVEFVFRTHPVTVSGNDLSIVFDRSDDIRQSVKLGKILFRCFFDICILLIFISFFCLTFLALLSLFSRWSFFTAIALKIDQNFILITTEQLAIEVWAQGIVLNQEIRQLLELEIIDSEINIKIRIEKSFVWEFVRLIELKSN